ncbi:MAG: CBS domain-containing protein [Pseudomonadales bacterium]|nr:CBS domain-containing protein [Pseudomonadales bacterium]
MTYKKCPTMAAVLTPFPYHIESSAALTDAVSMMEEHSLHHLIVMDNGDITSILSDRELQHHSAVYGIKSNNELLVGDLCSQTITAADINDPLDQVLLAMIDKHLDSVVIFREGELAGIFTTTDACIYFSRFLKEKYHPDEIPDLIA